MTLKNNYFDKLHKPGWCKLSVIIILMINCSIGFADTLANYPLGLIPPVPGQEKHYPVAEVQARRGVPVSVVNIEYLPVVRTQQLDNCGAFAPTYYYKTWQEAKEHGWKHPDPQVDPEHIMSPGFTYPLVNASQDNGANVGSVMDIICRYGCATWKTMPENSGDWVSYPREQAWREAMYYRGKEVVRYPTATDQDLMNLKIHLASGDLAVISIEDYADTFHNYPDSSCVGVNNEVVYNHGSQFVGYHALTLIGYDDNKTFDEDGTSRQGAFLAVNSWGPDWGVTIPEAGSGGFVWLSYDYVKSRRGNNFILEGALVMIDRNAYQPHDIAILTLDHPRRDELRLGITAGPRLPENSHDWLSAFPTAGSLMPFDGTIWLDVTDFYSDMPLAYWLRIEDLNVTGWSTTNGHIKAFSIERDGNIILQGNNLPLTTVDDQVDYLCAEIMVDSGKTIAPLSDGCYRLAIGDCTGDGHPDLAAVSGGNALGFNLGGNIFWKNSTGNFISLDADISGFSNAGLAWADIDRDGFQDIIIGGYKNGEPTTMLLHNQGFGFFYGIPTNVPGLGNPSFAWGDYDNDGDLDLVAQGTMKKVEGTSTSYEKVTRLYRNDAGTLVETGIVLPSVSFMPVAWSDIDGDGWLDLSVGSRLYKNMGNGTFQFRANPAGEGRWGMLAWQDYDKDGRVDFVISRIDDSSGAPITTIYHNDGNFSFSPLPTSIIGLQGGDLAWGDMDEDGLCDLALCGYPTMVSTEGMITRIYHQLQDGRFVDTGMNLTGVGDGGLCWLDIEGDNDPDLIASGLSPQVQSDQFKLNKTTTIYENKATQFIVSPQSPPIPTMLSARTFESHQSASGTDQESRTSGKARILLNWTMPLEKCFSCRYDIRVGTRPGEGNVISPADSVLSGIRRGRIYYNDGRTGLLLINPGPGSCFFWSIRSVDAAGNVSAWSPEAAFMIDNGVKMIGDVNADGKLDVADVVRTKKLLQSGAELPRCADVNSDGRVDAYDTLAMSHKLVGKINAGFSPIISQTIGTDGGTIDAGGISLEIPSGALNSTIRLTVSSSTSDPGYGSQGERTVYQIEGFPEYRNKAIVLRLSDNQTETNSPPWVALGRKNSSIGEINNCFKYRCREATPLADGRIELAIPVNPYPEHTKNSVRQAQRNATNKDFILKINLLSASQWRYNGNPRFTIVAPLNFKSVLPEIAEALQFAWDDLRLNFGINPQPYRDWVKHPLEIFIEDLGVSALGAPNAGETLGGSNNGCYIILNSRALKDSKLTSSKLQILMKTTAAHEFLHIIQNFFDARSSFMRYITDPNLWLNEAEATWYEYHIAKRLGYSHFEDANFTAQRPQTLAGCAGIAEDPCHFGYGSVTVIQHTVEELGLEGIRKLLEQAHNGIYGFQAINNVLKKYPDGTWLNKMMFDMLKKPYLDWDPSILTPLTPSANMVKVNSKDQLDHRFKCDFMSDFAFSFYKLIISPNIKGFAAGKDEKLAFKLAGDKHKHLQILRATSTGSGGITSLGNAVFASSASSEDASRIIIPDVKSLIDASKSTFIMPIITSSEDKPSPIETYACLSCGCVQDYQDEPLPQWTSKSRLFVKIGTKYNFFPTFTCTGAITSTDTGNLKFKKTLLSDGAVAASVQMDLWGASPSMEVVVGVNPENDKLDIGENHFQLIGHIKFKAVQYKIGRPYTEWDIIGTLESADGHFTLPANTSKEPQYYYVISAVYKIRYTVAGGSYDKTDEHQTTIISFLINHM